MDDYYSDNQPELIHCEYCGEDYAPMYKACPFCNTAPNGKKVRGSADRSRRTGGARVRTNTRGGGYGGAHSPLMFVGIGVIVVLVIAAIILVVALVKPLLASLSSSSDTSEAVQSGIVSYIEDTPEEDAATNSVTMSQTELTLDAGGTAALTVTVDPEDWTGTVSWASDNTEVATVDESGNVTYVAEGTCTISATAGGQTATCAVTCNAATADEPAAAVEEIVVTAYGNTMDGDFTIGVGESIPFKVTGGDGANYEWAIEDGGIATVDASGTCVGVAAGKTSLTVTSGGVSTTVTIRVK
jgi:hypothetical protein